ncbi:MAG: hypothetical protein ACI399_04635 [Candidatus Cryptobacteroides sp.]
MTEIGKRDYVVPDLNVEELDCDGYVLQNSIEGAPEDDPFVF